MEPVRCPALIGRDAELAALLAALAEAENSRGAMCVLTAEAGVGKSRLLREVAGIARQHGNLVLTGRAVASEISTPYRPLSEALLQASRESGLPNTARAPWLLALRDLLPAHFAAVAEPAAAPADVTPVMRGEAVLRLLRALASSAALLLGLEDLHWADPDTLAVVEYLADNLRGERVLCVVTVRSESRAPAYELVQALNERRNVQLLSLPRLSADETRRMVLACRPSAAPDELQYLVSTADGVPFLVEELLAAPGVPRSFAASVAARLARLTEADQRVIQLAAVLGRQFDWRLLSAVAGGQQAVGRALAHAVSDLLLDFEGDDYQFRHSLTREAIVESLLPHVRAELARAALRAMDAMLPGKPDPWRGIAADLAQQAGDGDRAAQLLLESGDESLRRGALATAIDTLRRACDLASPDGRRDDARTLLVEALALAGRTDECLSEGATLLRMSADAAPAARARTHLALAHAAVEATRWTVAASQLAAADRLLADDPYPPLTQRWRVLAAESALAARDMTGARRLAELVLQSADATADVRCHAFALLGRSHRALDLDAARAAFEDALSCAELENLPLWRLRALHELGTIELFEHAGTDRLRQARQMAGELGALSTAAVLDIQLTAGCIFRFDPVAAEQHAASSLAAAERLRLGQLRATALVFIAEARSLCRDRDGMERYNMLALAAASGDAEIEGSVWGARGVAALLEDDEASARRALQRSASCLEPLANAGPGIYRGLWPLMLAVDADPRAEEAIASARRTGVPVNRANRGLLLFAGAVLAGRRASGAAAAAELALQAAAELAHFPVWSDIGRMLAARAAIADGWGAGEPRRWLKAAAESFGGHGIEPLARRCHALLAEPARDRLSSFGVTPRELEILGLLSRGLSNKDIAARLSVSHRTVEKHVESLLRKTGSRSRTQLAAVRADALGSGSG